MVSVAILPLQVSDACVRRNGRTLVGPVDLVLNEQGFTIVMGPNGAGKTTLLRMMHGMERLSQGSIHWQVPEREARAKQAYVFQRPVIMRRNVLDNIAYPQIVRGVAKNAARRQASDWLERLGLSDAADRPAHVLSGGERQKLALARALISKPQILFLDEPCANLDGRAMRDIEATLLQVRKDGTRIVMATHDMGQARRLADDVLFIYRGEVFDSAPADMFFKSPNTREARAFLKGDILE